MKSFSSFIFSFVLFFLLSTTIAGPVFAAPTLTSPAKSTTITAYESTTLVAEGCPPGSSVRFGWKSATELFAHSISQNPTADANGKASYEFAGGFAPNTYTIWVECGGEEIKVDSAFTTEPIDDITVTTEEELGQTVLMISGCPPDSDVFVEWLWSADETPQLNGTYKRGTQELISDVGGKAELPLDSGYYKDVHVACGGIEITVPDFTASGDASGNVVFPTDPPPPPPVCELLSAGKCIEVNTAIGPVNTNGIGIISSVFLVLLSLSGGIMVLTIIYAGYLLMTSRGNPEQIQKGKELLTSAVIGFMFIIFSYVIFGIITTDILHLPGFSTSPYACPPYNPDCNTSL